MPSSDPPLWLCALAAFRNETVDYPEEVRRFVAVAEYAGYRLTPQDAHAIWRQYSDGLCAGWLVSEGLSDEQILETLLDNGVSGPDVPPPLGYASWLDYAVDTVCPPDAPLPPPDAPLPPGAIALEDVRRTARAELEELRRSRAAAPPGTSPAQRTHSVMEARVLLGRLAQLSPTSRLPADIPKVAEHLLQHFPGNPELDVLEPNAPGGLGLAPGAVARRPGLNKSAR